MMPAAAPAATARTAVGTLLLLWLALSVLAHHALADGMYTQAAGTGQSMMAFADSGGPARVIPAVSAGDSTEPGAAAHGACAACTDGGPMCAAAGVVSQPAPAHASAGTVAAAPPAVVGAPGRRAPGTGPPTPTVPPPVLRI
jgi:phage baseplate assembly protein gpV